MNTTLLDWPAPGAPPTVAERERQSEHLLDALKVATTTPGEHRLFRWGKLNGLFPSRVGPSAAAAKFALANGLLEHVRTEARGKLIVEWVRALPKAGEYLDDHDSPKAALRELQEVIGATRAGVPVWMAQARDEVAQLSMRFEHTAREMTRRLDSLTERVESALKRMATAAPALGEGLRQMVPWAGDALAFLDRRETLEATLGELFQVARADDRELSVTRFHEGVRKLLDGGLLRAMTTTEPIHEPEFAMEFGGQLVWKVRR